MGQDARACHPPPFRPRHRLPVQLDVCSTKVLGASAAAPIAVRPFCFDTFPQPAVETPVFDSPLAQRVREEGASLFVGFSFERPSLLLRRRSRPHHVPVEDCFMGLEFSAEAQNSSNPGLAMGCLSDDGAAVEAVASADDGNAGSPSRAIAAASAVSAEEQWFDIPPPDSSEDPRTFHKGPSTLDYFDVEDEILRGGHLKQGGGIGGGVRPKASSKLTLPLQSYHHLTLIQGGRNASISFTKHPVALTVGALIRFVRAPFLVT